METLNPWDSYIPEVGDQIDVTYLYTGPAPDILPLLSGRGNFIWLLERRPGVQVREVRRLTHNVCLASILIYRQEGTLTRQLAPAIHVGDGKFEIKVVTLRTERLTATRVAAIGAADELLENTEQRADKMLGAVADALPEPRTTISVLTLIGLGIGGFLFLQARK